MLLQLFLRIPGKGTPTHLVYTSDKKKNFTFSSKSPVREAPPPCSPNGVPMERDASSPEPVLHSFIYISHSPQLRSLPTKCRNSVRAPSTEPHADGRPTYNGVWSGSPRGSCTTLLSLPRCRAVFSTIPSTLAWVDQSSVSQRVIVTLNRVCPSHLLPTPTWPRVRIHVTLRYRGGFGFMGVFTDNIYII
jgi:hypothetical protein